MRFLILALLISGCTPGHETNQAGPSVVKFWTISSLQFDDEDMPLDACTSEDYLDVRDDGIALSFHCEYPDLDSVATYHTHKLNWEWSADSTFEIYSDGRALSGTLVLDDSGQLHMRMLKSNNRMMHAVFR